jgi:hypothetical protein
MTSVATEEFALELPPGWVERPNPERKEYVSSAGDEQVLVDVWRTKAQRAPALRAAVDTLVAVRKECAAELAQGACILMPVEHEDADGRAATSYTGVDLRHQIDIYARVVAVPGRIVSVSCHHLQPGGDRDAWVDRAQAVTGSLVVKGRPRRRWWLW